MSHNTRVHKHNHVALSVLDELVDLVDDVFFRLWVVRGRCARERDRQALGGYLLENHVSGEGEIDGARFGDTSGDGLVNLGCGIRCVCESDLVDNEGLRGLDVGIEPSA